MNEVIRQLYERKSVRAFETTPIPENVKAAILESAFQAPTAGNQMLYSIIDVTDEALKQRLSVLCDNQPFIATAPLVLVFLADTQRWLDIYRAAGLTPRAPEAGDALLAMADTVIAAQNTVVAAHSFGLGSCYIGDILEHAEAIREELNLTPYVFPAAMLVYGYPTEQQKTRQKPARFHGEYVVHENRYTTLPAEAHRDAYVRRAEAQGRTTVHFEGEIDAFMTRKYASEFSKEMSRSAAVYLKAFLKED